MVKLIIKIKVLTILLCILFFSEFVSALGYQENPLTKAIQLFDKKKFSDAEIAFRKLLEEKPEDFMINYFYGACRTENGFYSDADLGFLEKASKEVYPIDIDYYFGVQYHAKNLFNKALIHYNNFRKVATDEEIKRVNLIEKIELCENRTNPFKLIIPEPQAADTAVVVITDNDSSENVTQLPVPVDTLSEMTTDSIEVPSSANKETLTADSSEIRTEDEQTADRQKQTDSQPQPATEQSETEIVKPAESLIDFNVNSEISYLYESHFKTNEGLDFYKQAIEKQESMDKIILRTEILRGHYSKSKSKAEKDSLGQLIVELENEAYQTKGIVKQLFGQAKSAENNYWQNATAEEKEKFLAESEQIKKAISNKKTSENAAPVSGILLSPLLVDDAPVEKPAKENKGAGILYKIQLGAFSKGIPNNLKPVFKKITVIRKVENYIDDKGIVVYTTGNLNSYDDALVMLNQVKQEGVKDAIIAAYQNGKRITLEQAKETEKQK